jgi:glycosyltransferase involved in cell wall biosynthesis
VFREYGIEPHPNLTVLSLPTVRLPRLPFDAFVHPRLAVWNWSYGLAAILSLRTLAPNRRPRLVLARDPRLARLFIQAREVTRCEVVYEVHELFSTRAREAVTELGPGPPTRAPRIRRLEEAVFEQAALLITLTEGCKRLLVEEFGVPTARVLVAPDAVATVPESLPRRSGDGRKIVYAGQLYPWKGVGTLVRALELLPDARLRIVGGLTQGDPHTDALRRLAGQVGVIDRIEFTGFVPHAKVGSAISEAAVAAVPLPDNPMSRYFTSPLKMFEYMAAGLPIVASDLPALREVLRHEENALLVPPDDPSALADALRRLLSDANLADRLRTQAQADVRGWTWSARADRIGRSLTGVLTAAGRAELT